MTEDVVAALADHAIPLADPDPDADPSDLAPLADRLSGATVVGLGEATHGTREFFALRHRLTRFLVAECGFRAVGIEAEAGAVAPLGEYVVTGDGDPAEALGDLRPWWRTEGMLSFLRWLRGFNEDRPPGERVRLYGVDVGDPSEAAAGVASVLRALDPEYYRSVEPVLGALAAGEATERGPDDGAWFERAEGVANDIADRIDRYRGERRGAHPPHELERAAYLARAVAASCAWYRGGGAAEGLDPEGYETRDRRMADNAARRARALDGLVLWAHDGHLARGTFDDGRPWSDAETAGEHLRREFGDGYRPIGTEFGRGRFRAIDAGAGEDGFDTFEAETPPESSLSAHLSSLEGAPFYLDLAAAREDPPLRSFLGSPRRLRNVEAAYDPDTDHEYFVESAPAASFDGVVFFEETRPARPLGAVEPEG